MIATEALLKTKLYAPRAHPNLMPRPRLSELLAAGMDRKLTLLSAPAGFGKSTLLSEWHMLHPGSDNPVAWVSLEKTDNDPTRFLSYLITALQTIEADIGAAVLVSLRSPQPPPIEPMLTALINEITATPRDFVLVLDDYHFIEAEAIHGALAFLLEHLPRQMHLILCGRTDPPLPLSRLRVQDQITELRADDLRFTSEEAATFLNDVMGLDLPAEDVTALAAGTEGWIAALQLAALSMRKRSDVSGFVDAFKGSHRHVLDYLTEEVLERQPARVQTFLLETSILDRLTAKLCEEVTGGDDGQALLERLEHANLFTIPLDDERLWYRYHHLFADMLRHRLHQGSPERVTCLHRRAAGWYERQRLVDDAIEHALAAEDNAWAAQLVEQNTEKTVMRSEGATLLRWLEALPEELVRSRPRLSIAHAIASLFGGRLEDIEPLLRNAERALGGLSDASGSSSADDGTGGWLADIPSCLAIIRGDLARMRGEVPPAIEFSRQALARLPAGTSYLRSKATWNLGVASWLGGDLATADEAFAELIAANRASGNTYLPVLASSGLGLLRTIQGRLHEAAEAYRGAVRLGGGKGKVSLPVAGWAYLGLGDLLREWNDQDAAMRHLEEGIELGKRVGQAGPVATGYTILARVLQTRGNTSGALDAIEKARQAAPDPGVHQLFGALAPHWARVWLEQGDVSAAARWARESGLSINDDPGFVREPEHIVLARVLIARGEHDKALQLLGRLLLAAQAGGRTGRMIEILVLQALARLAEGHTSLAMSTLARALPLAEPEGYIRVFADEGAPMAGLLRHASVGGASPGYAGELLAACEQATRDRAPRTRSAVGEGPQPLSEPLSERELEVLRLIALGQSNREIARELYVSLGTIKTHINNTYRKLGVHSRVRAVARARDLKLI
ncbi:MAG: helix-turn-helix transcriptional regulator [Rubrobacter sp.]|nr:helix-turn-helix transcriptional regulator [Rubrobacter sp.]